MDAQSWKVHKHPRQKNLRVGRCAITHHMYKKIMTDGGFLLWLKLPIASVGVCTNATDLSNRRVPMLVCREGYESGARLDQSHKNWSAHFLYYRFWCSFDYFKVWAVDRTKQGFTLCHFEVWEIVGKRLEKAIAWANLVCVNINIFFKLASSYFRHDHKCLKYANMSLRRSWCYLVITKKSSGGNITLMMVRVKFHSVLGDSLTCCRGTWCI